MTGFTATRRQGALVFLGLLAAVFVVGGLGAFATLPQIPGWYRALAKPPWTPPDWLFGPAWTVLYIAMAVAAFLVWRRPAQAARSRGLWLWTAQLIANALWSPLFFGAHRLGLALIDIAVLWLLIVATMVAFRPVRGLAAGLLVPYLLWVTFAAALNAAIWQLNG
ncbi:MAG TPA: TspO/MBR family protein [Aliidongia sp.]|uniref:TspO/MBR family protein n=1 Tax=Aliidongia sp. TaxID=1914230 RepID=UPI002DDD862B|nr:TspO/MBR family protein [Aliidongia sp.]HEV2677861.1 TspO/MBR family protein [Aliidongia sp.]